MSDSSIPLGRRDCSKRFVNNVGAGLVPAHG
jgi:hypothetical protein